MDELIQVRQNTFRTRVLYKLRVSCSSRGATHCILGALSPLAYRETNLSYLSVSNYFEVYFHFIFKHINTVSTGVCTIS